MENKIKIFNNNEFGKIRTVLINDEPWFVGKDAASILGYSNASKAVLTHVDIEDKQFVMLNIADSQNGNMPIGQSKTAIINESGLYSLIFLSKMPNAKKFKHWITSEVLPAIRRHGVYMTPEVIEKTLTDPDYIIKLATVLKEERTARELAEQKLEEQKPLVHFANKVSDSSNLIDMGKMAKLLKDEKINIGRNRLFEWLRNKGILMKNNVPYQKYIESGYFKVKERVCETPYGFKTKVITFVTGKGQIYIAENLRKEYSQ